MGLFAEAPAVILNDGRLMPQLGFGTSGVWEDQAPRVVGEAVAAGFRLVDTAACYGNERGVGQAVRTAVAAGEAVFVTTKVWNTDQGYDKTIRALEASLSRLGLGAVDLYLIHWPLPARNLYVETWQALVRLRAEGRVRSIGVSNFGVPHLQRLIDETGVVPAVNQIEVHPHFQQRTLREFHREVGIVTQAWSPLGAGACLADPVVRSIAAARGLTPAQVVLSWHLALGVFPIPKSVSAHRIRENARAGELHLTDEDLAALSALDAPEGRIGPDPERLDLESFRARWVRRLLSLAANPADIGKRLRRFIRR